MVLTRTATTRLLRLFGIALIIIVIVAYAIWRSLNYARGPEIRVLEPIDGTTISSTTIEIKGQVMRATNLTLNGDTISVDQSGNFDEIRIAFPGINDLTLSATDQFNRRIERHLTILGTVPLPSPRTSSKPTTTITSTSTGQ